MASPGPTPPGPRELTGIVDLTRGKEHPTARLSGPGPRQVWHRVQELARRARRRLPCGGANRDAGPLPGTARTPSMTSSKTPPASWMSSISSSSLATLSMRYAAASIKTHPPEANARRLVSLRDYQPVPSPKSLAWAGPYANGRTPSWPTSIPTEPATHRTEAINGHYRTRQTHRQRLPQPQQLPTPNAPNRRKPRRLHTHPTMKSRINRKSLPRRRSVS